VSAVRARFNSAFTLVEVLVALSILALSAVVLGSAYVNVLISYESLSRDFQGDEDLRFAMSQLLSETKLESVEEGAEFEGVKQRRLRWKAEVEPTNVADLFTVTFQCEISDPAKGSSTVTRRFRLLRPTWSEATERQKLKEDARKRIEELNKGRAR